MHTHKKKRNKEKEKEKKKRKKKKREEGKENPSGRCINCWRGALHRKVTNILLRPTFSGPVN